MLYWPWFKVFVASGVVVAIAWPLGWWWVQAVAGTLMWYSMGWMHAVRALSTELSRHHQP